MIPHMERLKRSLPQAGTKSPHRTQTAIPFDQLFIFLSPWIAAAVKRILVPFHSRLVAVVHTRNTRQSKLQYGGQTQQAQSPLAMLRRKAGGALPFAAAVSCGFAPQHGQSALRIVRTDMIHQKPYHLRRIVFHDRKNPIHHAGRVRTGQKTKNCVAERIVHHAVQLCAEQIFSALSIS